MTDLEKELYNELAYYTLGLHDITFIHQHVVDAYYAQTADSDTKPVTLTFALAGIYLCIEKNYTGREVQLFHMKMAKHKRKWPVFILPSFRGDIHISDVLAIPPGKERDKMIYTWCGSVWKSFESNRDAVIELAIRAAHTYKIREKDLKGSKED